MECTQVYSDDDIVADIVSAGTQENEVEEEEEPVHNVGTLSEQLTSIAHVKRMFVSRGMDNRVVLAGLRQLQRELRMERRAGLAQTTIDQFFGGQQ